MCAALAAGRVWLESEWLLRGTRVRLATVLLLTCACIAVLCMLKGALDRGSKDESFELDQERRGLKEPGYYCQMDDLQ